MSFLDLNPNEQRILIDRCITEKGTEIEYKKIIYKLPPLIQLTYKCKKCRRTFNTRFYSADLKDKANFATSMKCSSCKDTAHLANKSIPRDIEFKEKVSSEEEDE